MTDQEMAAHLSGRGYLVAKIPPCSRQGRGHGRHVLITRSGTCDGEEPMPHAFVNLHQGSFGIWVNCACGHGFADYRLDDADELTPWEQHEAEHGISTATATKRKDG